MVEAVSRSTHVGHRVRLVMELVVAGDPRVPALLLAEHDLVHVGVGAPFADLEEQGFCSVGVHECEPGFCWTFTYRMLKEIVK